MKSIQKILLIITFAITLPLTHAAVVYGTIKGLPSTNESQSNSSAVNALKNVVHERQFAWIAPLKTTTNKDSKGMFVTTIIYKAAEPKENKTPIDEQISQQIAAEKALGIKPNRGLLTNGAVKVPQKIINVEK